jgi:hypothetical protein
VFTGVCSVGEMLMTRHPAPVSTLTCLPSPLPSRTPDTCCFVPPSPCVSQTSMTASMQPISEDVRACLQDDIASLRTLLLSTAWLLKTTQTTTAAATSGASSVAGGAAGTAAGCVASGASLLRVCWHQSGVRRLGAPVGVVVVTVVFARVFCCQALLPVETWPWP